MTIAEHFQIGWTERLQHCQHYSWGTSHLTLATYLLASYMFSTLLDKNMRSSTFKGPFIPSPLDIYWGWDKAPWRRFSLTLLSHQGWRELHTNDFRVASARVRASSQLSYCTGLFRTQKPQSSSQISPQTTVGGYTYLINNDLRCMWTQCQK